GQRAMDLFFERYRAAYPRLREEFAAIFDRVRRGVKVTVRDHAGRAVTVQPNVAPLADGIRHHLYIDTGGELAEMIPRASAGDLAPIVQAAIDAELLLDRELALGLWLSVTCAEHMPYSTPALA